jgi:hypothetical protein
MKWVFRKKPAIKKKNSWGVEIMVPNGIIAHLTRECGGNVHDCHVVDVTSSKPSTDWMWAGEATAAKNVTDFETNLCFFSVPRYGDDIPHTRNNWMCYDFKERRIVPTHYTIRTNPFDRGSNRLKSWLVETSTDGQSWQEVAHEEDNQQLNGCGFTSTFAVTGGGECRLIRLVNICRNHFGNDNLYISAWEIYGSLLE